VPAINLHVRGQDIFVDLRGGITSYSTSWQSEGVQDAISLERIVT